jgi:hypothetical protein
MEWNRRTFRIHSANARDGALELVPVDGIVLGKAPWFGIHIRGHEHADVTHVPTGRRIASFSTLGAALEYAETIVPWTNWRSENVEISPACLAEMQALATKLGVVPEAEG